MESIIQQGKYCLLCGTTRDLNLHHCLHGTANRKKADKYGLTVYLCVPHHTGKNGVHFNKEFDLYLKQRAQKAFEKAHSRQEWMREFGKNYLDEKELYHE